MPTGYTADVQDGKVTKQHQAYAVELVSKLGCWGRDMTGQPNSLGHIDLDLVAQAICDAESRGELRASERQGGDFWQDEALRLTRITSEIHHMRFGPTGTDEKRWARIAELLPGPPPAMTVEGALGALMAEVCENPGVQMECDLADALGVPPGAHAFDEMCSMVEALKEAPSQLAPVAAERQGGEQWLDEVKLIIEKLDHAETLHADTMRFQYTYAAEDLGHLLAQHRAELMAALTPSQPAPSADAAMARWVPVTERLPDPYEIVQFVTGPGKGASPWDRRVGDRTGGPSWIWRDYTALDRHGETDIFEDHQVAYWAPLLPAPPGGGK